MKINQLKYLVGGILISSIPVANAAEIDMNTAQLQAMDKITGRVSLVNVPVNGSIDFGSLNIVVRSCKTRPVEEAPENFAFIDVTDKTIKGDEFNIFKGWMISSSPATNAVEHPIYDVWLLRCLNTDIDEKSLLTEQQLVARDELPMEGSLAPNATIQEKDKKTTKDKQISEPISEMQEETRQTETTGDIEVILPSEFSFDEDDDDENNSDDLKEEIRAELERLNLKAD